MNPQYYGAAADYNNPKNHPMVSKKLLLIAGGIVLGLIIIATLFSVVGTLTSGPRNEVARLAARVQQTQKFISDNNNTIGSGELKKINSEAELFLGTDLSALQKVYDGKLPDSITATETDTTSEKELKDATQAGKFDSTYLELLRTKIAACLDQAQKVRDATSGAQTKTVATQAANNLMTISEALNKLSL